MKTFWQNILIELQNIFQPSVLVEFLAQLLSKIIIAAIILFIFYIGWLTARAALRIIFKQSSTNEMTSTFLLTLTKYSILIIGIVTALDSAGIKISAVLASIGIAGLTIGFAAKDSLSNIIAGVLIFLDRPFVIGDLVEIEGLYGRVDKITLRSTRIVTVDGKMLAVPNIEVINKTVASYTNFPHLRIDIPVTIAVDEDIDKARKVLLGLVLNNTTYLDNPAPRVVVRELNDYNVKLELQVWIKEERKHIEYRFALREKVFKGLLQAGIEMPYETISINPVEIKSTK